MLPNTGERQVHRELVQIKPNHRERYKFAKLRIQQEYAFESYRIKVLDAACGIGYGTTILSHAHPGYYLGVDNDKETIQEAQTYYIEQGLGPSSEVAFEQLDLADEKAWPYSETRFDAIVSIETIEHVSDADSLIQRFASSTDLLVGSVPNEDVVPFVASNHPFHFRHYTKGQFEELLNDHGFHVEMWATQYNKIPGTVFNKDDGMGFIVMAKKVK